MTFSGCFLVFHVMNLLWLHPENGDLIRRGYIYQYFKEPVNVNFNKIGYIHLSEISDSSITNINVLTIGDSFFDRGECGVQNILAKKGEIVVNHDIGSYDNPFQKSVELLNSDFFDLYEVDAIYVESVERAFIQRAENMRFDELGNKFEDLLKGNIRRGYIPSGDFSFFSPSTVMAPYANISYQFFDRPPGLKTVMVPLRHEESTQDYGLCYYEDIESLVIKNDLIRLKNALENIAVLDTICKHKGIDFYLVIVPDKYDILYESISDSSYVRSQFWKNFYSLDKPFNYVDVWSKFSSSPDRLKLYLNGDGHLSEFGDNLFSHVILSHE